LVVVVRLVVCDRNPAKRDDENSAGSRRSSYLLKKTPLYDTNCGTSCRRPTLWILYRPIRGWPRIMSPRSVRSGPHLCFLLLTGAHRCKGGSNRRPRSRLA